MTVVFGTAGHIDHGKTALLRALTGIDADRLPEERVRGMTIDVGYAHMALDDGTEVDFVDVPGHDRLVGNMLVGAGEVDACLLVVAADDGPRAQTLEHLELLDALGVGEGVAVVTKADLVDGGRLAEVHALVADLLARTRLADVEVVEVSALTGAGIELLREAIARCRDRALRAIERRSPGPPRLAIDRVFSVRGRGLVVTGTLRGRGPRSSDALALLPGGAEVRVREIQVHGRRVEGQPGPGRVALNLAGVTTDVAARGQVLTVVAREARAVRPTDRLLVMLERPAPLRPGRPAESAEPWPPRRAGARLHVGTDQLDALLLGLTRSEMFGPRVERARDAAGAHIRLERPVAAAAGDRFVLRRPRPAGLLAGGVILDPEPPRGASRRRVTPGRLAALADALTGAEAGALEEARVDLHGILVEGRSVRVAPDVAAAVAEALRTAVRDHHAAHPDEPGMPVAALRTEAARAARRQAAVTRAHGADVADVVLEQEAAAGRLVREGDRVRRPSHHAAGVAPAMAAAMDRLEALLDVPMAPPLPTAAREAGCPEAGVRELERSGRIVVLDDDVAWSRRVHAELSALAKGLAASGPLTPAALRDAAGTSRRYVMALLADLDRRGVLRRTPAGHVPGPRPGS